MEKLSFTLYEVFGYFLPGVVGVAAIAILFWAIFLPGVALPVQSIELSKLWYFGLVVLSYYAGHVLQEISRWVFENKSSKSPDETALGGKTGGMLQIITYAKKQLDSKLGLASSDKLDNIATVTLCDEVGVQYGQPGDRDMFVYREGFYRGSAASLVFLDLALLARSMRCGSALLVSGVSHPVLWCHWAFAMGVITCSIVFLITRYKHFADLRAMHGVLAFVSLSCFPGLGKKPEEVKPGS